MLFSCMKGVVGYCIILGTLVSWKPMLLSNWVSHVWRKVGAGWLSRHAVWEKHRNTWGPKMADPTTIDFYPVNNIKHYSFWMVQWFMVLVYSHLPIAMTWRKSLGGVLFDFPGFMTCSGAKVNWAARFGGANSCGGRVFQGVLRSLGLQGQGLTQTDFRNWGSVSVVNFVHSGYQLFRSLWTVIYF